MSKKRILICVLLVVWTIIISNIWWLRLEDEDSQWGVFANSGNFLEKLKEGDVIEQEVPILLKRVQNIKISFATFANDNNQGELVISVTNSDGVVFAEKTVDIAEIADNSYEIVELNEYPEKGEVLTVTVEIIEMTEESELTCFVTNADDTAYDLFINGQYKPYEISMYVGSYVTYGILGNVLFIILSITILGLIIYLCKEKFEYQTAFLIGAIGLGMVYMIMLPARTIPDEDAHILTAYSISNKILHTDEVTENNKILMRNCDIYSGYTTQPTDESMVDLLDRYFMKPSDDRMYMMETSYKRDLLDVPLESYFASAFGITVGRVFQLSGAMTLLLGKLMNYIVYVVAVYFAIKRIPFGKCTLAIVSLLPMVIQQASSYSYDSLLVAMIITFISYVCVLMKDNTKLKVWDVVLLIFSVLVLCRLKSHAYMPLVGVLAIPFFKRRKEFNAKKVVCILSAFLGMTIVLSVLNTILKTDINLVSNGENSYYTINYLLENFDDTIMLVVNTVMLRGDFYLYSMLSSPLSHCTISVPLFVALGLGVILLISMIPVKNEKIYFNSKEKIYSSILAVISIFGIIAAMLLSFTIEGFGTIEGVQGRYFIPSMIVLLIVLRNDNIQIKRDIGKYLLVSSVVLQYVVIYSVLTYCLR